MLIANARLRNDEYDSDVPLENITPAEAVVLASAFMPQVQDYPLDNIQVVGEVERTPLQERKRLTAKYGRWVNKKEVRISALFPGVLPGLPKDFEEARAAVEQDFQLPETGLEAEAEARALAEATPKGRPQTDA